MFGSSSPKRRFSKVMYEDSNFDSKSLIFESYMGLSKIVPYVLAERWVS